MRPHSCVDVTAAAFLRGASAVASALSHRFRRATRGAFRAGAADDGVRSPVAAMPPVAGAVAGAGAGALLRQSDAGGDNDTTTLELTLITLALLTSIVLSVIPSARVLNRARRPLASALVVALALLSCLCALVLSLLALALGWSRDISLDALAGVVFALAPALIQLPRDTLRYGLLALRLRTRVSLRVAAPRFRYVRFGRACGRDLAAARPAWAAPFPACAGPACCVGMFIRALPLPPARSSRPDAFGLAGRVRPRPPAPPPADDAPLLPAPATTLPESPAPTTSAVRLSSVGPPPPAAPEAELLHWHGRRVGHSRNFVLLRDLDDGITSWWWDAVSSAVHLVDKPPAYYVKNAARMLNALALLSDIISIGELVIRHRRAFLSWQLAANNGVRACVTATPGIVCNKIMAELGLCDWGTIGIDTLEHDIPETSRKKYGVLFLVLAEKSQMFSENPAHDGDDVCPWDDSGPAEGPAARTSPLAWCRRLVCMGCRCCPSWLQSKSNQQRLSGQEILDELMRNGDLPPDDFEQMSKRLVDRWMNAWGCRWRSLKSETVLREQLHQRKGAKTFLASMASSSAPSVASKS